MLVPPPTHTHTQVHLWRVAESVVRLTRPLMRDHVRILNCISRDMPPVQGDSARLMQVCVGVGVFSGGGRGDGAGTGVWLFRFVLRTDGAGTGGCACSNVLTLQVTGGKCSRSDARRSLFKAGHMRADSVPPLPGNDSGPVADRLAPAEHSMLLRPMQEPLSSDQLPSQLLESNMTCSAATAACCCLLLSATAVCCCLLLSTPPPKRSL